MKERKPEWLADETRQAYISGFLAGIGFCLNYKLTEDFDLDDAIDKADEFYEVRKKVKDEIKKEK